MVRNGAALAGTDWQIAIAEAARLLSGKRAFVLASPPVITQSPSNLDAYLGQTPTFTVQTTGSPAPGYQWSFNGVPLTEPYLYFQPNLGRTQQDFAPVVVPQGQLWVMGDEHIFPEAFTNVNFLLSTRYSLFANYLQSLAVYKCPADKTTFNVDGIDDLEAGPDQLIVLPGRDTQNVTIHNSSPQASTAPPVTTR